MEVRGFEPLTSSVRVRGGPPLCRPAFPRSARIVRGEVRRSDPEQLRRGRGYRHLGLLGACLLWRDVQGEDDPVASLILSLAAVSTSKAVSGLPRRPLGGVNRLTVVLRPRRHPWFVEVGAR